MDRSQGVVNEDKQKQSLITQKHALKQQAKQTLLKQCYKMAMNKYFRLIQMGPQGFLPREWSIVHLNTAICLQYQNRLKQALQQVNKSIRVDPTYEKAYYRRLQLLDDLGEYELVLHDGIVPAFVRNAEIEKLRDQIVRKYRNSVGFVGLMSKLQDGSFVEQLGTTSKVNGFVDDCLGSIFGRIEQELGKTAKQTKQQSGLSKMGQQLDQFYKFLISKNNEHPSWLNCLCHHVYRLCLKYGAGGNQTQYINLLALLYDFWISYCQIYLQPLTNTQLPQILNQQPQAQQKKQSQAYQSLLALYCPCSLINHEVLHYILNTLITVQEPSTTNIIKLLHNNTQPITHFLQGKLKQWQINMSQKHINKIDGIIDEYICMVRKRCSFGALEEYQPVMVIADSLLSLGKLLRDSALMNGIKLQKQISGDKDEFVELFRLRHQLQFDTSTTIHDKIFNQLAKILKSYHAPKLPPFPLLYLSYQTLHCIHPSVSRTDHPQLEQLIFLSLSSQPLCHHFLSNSTNEQDLFKYVLLVNMMGYFNPLFVVKCMTEAKEKAKGKDQGQTGNLMIMVWYALCQVQQMLARFGFGVNKSRFADAHKRYVVAVYMEALSLMCISDLSLLNLVQNHTVAISTVYQSLLTKNQPQPLDRLDNLLHSHNILHSAIKLLYCLATDIKVQQQKQYAQKMGVNEEDIKKAKQLQGEYKDTQLLNLVNSKREAMVTHIVGNFGGNNGWGEILNCIVAVAGARDDKADREEQVMEAWMVVSIVLRLCEKDSTKFYGPIVVNYMLDCFKKYTVKPQQQPSSSTARTREKIVYKIGHFFSQTCKKCNPNIFAYPQLQPITNCLLSLVEAAKHQLHIFQSLLSLINLSARNITVPLSIIQQVLLEENEYLVHGGLELLNNVLVNVNGAEKDDKYWKKLVWIQDIVHKYYKFYRQTIEEQIKTGIIEHKVNATNYSHPYKIYCTLISLLLVLGAIQWPATQQPTNNKIYNVQQLENWNFASRMLTHMDKNKGNVGMTVFKLVLHHAEGKTLPGGWWKHLEGAVGKLKEIDVEKWGKIQKYMK